MKECIRRPGLIAFTFIFLFLIVIQPSFFDATCEQTGFVKKGNWNIASDDTEHMCLTVPWFQMEGNLGFSCPASLQMLFKYYGVDVGQINIFHATFSDRLSDGTKYEWFSRGASYQDYNDENWGFQGSTFTLGHLNREDRNEFIKQYLREGLPVFALCKKFMDWPCHYKLFIGFDERSGYWYHNDPWYRGGDGDKCGPMSVGGMYPGDSFDERWNNTNYRVGIVLPIRTTLEIPERPVTVSSEFDLVCNINTTYLELDSDILLNLTLPEGFSIVDGIATPTIALNDSVREYTWKIQASNTLDETAQLRVVAKASNANYTTGGCADIKLFVPNAPLIDAPISSYQDDSPPYRFSVVSSIAYEEEYTAQLVTFSYSDTARLYPEYHSLEIVDDSFSITLGNYRPRKHVFCWVEVSTTYENYTSDKTIFYIQSSDVDNDGVEDYREIEQYGCDPSLFDTDSDSLSDYDEIFVHYTNASSQDSDGDQLLDNQEVELGTNPLVPDSDGDGDLDGVEYHAGSDPLNPESTVQTVTEFRIMIVGALGGVAVILVMVVFFLRKS